jgi:phospholipid/cholesterol/gamma-HCH transport system substrate-binding protein
VGVVENVIFNYEQQGTIVAVMGLDKQLRLPKGSTAEISSDLLGNVKLELKFGPNPVDLLAPGDTISGIMQLGAMGKAAQMIPQIEVMLPKLDSILASINALVADPALSGTIHKAEQLTASLNTTARQLNQLTASLNREMPKMMNKAQGVLSNTETLTSNLSQLNLDATMQRVDATLANVQQLSATLNSNKGTIGLLMNDPNLYDNLNSTMQSVNSLLTDFKEHPRRYINVSVFGKKDK